MPNWTRGILSYLTRVAKAGVWLAAVIPVEALLIEATPAADNPPGCAPGERRQPASRRSVPSGRRLIKNPKGRS